MPNANAVKKMTYARSHTVTMSAGSSINQKRMGLLSVALLLLVGLVAPVAAQTGQVMPPPKFTAYDSNGDPCSGCKLFAYAATTTTKQDTYTTSALSVANANPVVLDAAGWATVFLSPTLSYKFVLAPADDTDPPASAIWTVDNVVGPFSGVVTITAANTRGLQISRAGADAGLSIASTGGSGKTYGITSNTSGALIIRDDADGTPNITISGNDVTTTATGTVVTTGNQTISGTLGVTGATTLGALTATTSTFSGVATHNAAILSSSVSPAVTFIETDAAANTGRWSLVADGGYLQMQIVNDAGTVTGTPLYITRSGSAASVIYLDTPVVANTGRYNSATLQPGFLAYNSTLDGVATGGTVDFDTEVYDEAGNFSADTFTAPVTGRYQLCVAVMYSDNSAATYGLRLVTTARTYQIDWSAATSSGVSSGCVYADMSASATALVQVLTGDVDIDIEGGASPMVTYFSGRLVP